MPVDEQRSEPSNNWGKAILAILALGGIAAVSFSSATTSTPPTLRSLRTAPENTTDDVAFQPPAFPEALPGLEDTLEYSLEDTGTFDDTEDTFDDTEDTFDDTEDTFDDTENTLEDTLDDTEDTLEDTLESAVAELRFSVQAKSAKAKRVIEYAPVRPAISGSINICCISLKWKDKDGPTLGKMQQSCNEFAKIYNELSGGLINFNVAAMVVDVGLPFDPDNVEAAENIARNQAIATKGKAFDMFAIVHSGARGYSNANGITAHLKSPLVRTILHEVGHLSPFRLEHTGAIDRKTGKFNTYGDCSSFMSSCPSEALNAPQLYFLGWLPKEKVAQHDLADPAPMVYKLEPLDAKGQTDAVKAIRILTDKGEIFLSLYNQEKNINSLTLQIREDGGTTRAVPLFGKEVSFAGLIFKRTAVDGGFSTISIRRDPSYVTKRPTKMPTYRTFSPTTRTPTKKPSTARPTGHPTKTPTKNPTGNPTQEPKTARPTGRPTVPTRTPTIQPTVQRIAPFTLKKDDCKLITLEVPRKGYNFRIQAGGRIITITNSKKIKVTLAQNKVTPNDVIINQILMSLKLGSRYTFEMSNVNGEFSISYVQLIKTTVNNKVVYKPSKDKPTQLLSWPTKGYLNVSPLIAIKDVINDEEKCAIKAPKKP